jgi:hypothetical protein
VSASRDVRWKVNTITVYAADKKEANYREFGQKNLKHVGKRKGSEAISDSVNALIPKQARQN